MAEEQRDQERATGSVLFVTGVFPPVNTAGSYRLMRFAGWMHGAGWHVQVVTQRPNGHEPVDPTLLAELPAEITIQSTATFYPLRSLATLKRVLTGGNRASQARVVEAGEGELTGGSRRSLSTLLIDLLSVPDQELGWLPRAAIAGIRVARSSRCDAIVSSGPPHTAHLVAMVIKVLTRRPWVADLRDPWARAPWARHGKLAVRLNKWAERIAIRRADKVVLNTPQLLVEFRSLYAGLPGDKFRCVTNGFDEGLLDLANPVRPRDPGTGPIRIIHAGNLYGQRDPKPLLAALGSLVQQGLLARDAIEVVFIGSIDDKLLLREKVQELGISDMMRLVPKTPHREALDLVSQSDVLLLIQQGAPLQTPSKLFEYMALKRPVLGLVDAGSTADVIEQGRLGFAVSPADQNGLEKALLSLTSEEYRFAPDEDFILGFAGRRLSAQFERIVLEATTSTDARGT